MILVLDNEVRPDERFLGPELARYLDATYQIFPDDPVETVPADVDALVLAGSSAGAYEEYDWLPLEARLVHDAVENHVPTLAVCFGHQLVNQALGGTVEPMSETRAGLVTLRDYDGTRGLFAGLTPRVPALNGDRVVERGRGMEAIARVDHDANFATKHVDAPLWTVQFHPECSPQHADYYDEWSETEAAWVGTNATRVLDNFRELAE